ncbi:peptidoglycan bridge formation glycyltransferase FemA/FemB family protein [Candidatus Gracilibacteria bacterium]|nr:peptidoglycan bridge formation glycyltransferase FemA/FemB family protein [Candidatus Gracilibacteria bacterium]
MSIWQTESWQNMLVASGQSEEYFVIELDYSSEQKTSIFVEKRKVSAGEYGMFVQGLEQSIDNRLEESLTVLCQEENCLFVQVETVNYGGINLSETTEYSGDFKKGYYKKFMPEYTALIDLTQTEDVILAAMKPKGRYNIRLAEKKGVVVEQVEKIPYNAKKFYELMQETTSRDDFSGNNLIYYETFLKTIESSQLFFAYYDGKVIAAGIFVLDVDVATYYYGASGNTHRNLMAPYLLQWTAICHAKKRGMKTYDFLGVASPDDAESPLAGVTDFKMKLSPRKTHVSEGYIYVNKKIKYQVIKFLRKLKK